MDAEFEGRDRTVAAEFKGRDLAIEVRATNIERRLNELNHAHEKAAADKVQFVSQDRYHSAHQALIDRISALEKMSSNLQGRFVAFAAVFACLVAIANWLLAYLRMKT